MDNSITIISLRNELIGEILQLGDESILQQIKQYIADKKYREKGNKKPLIEPKIKDLPADLKAYAKPLTATIDFEAILKQQNFKPIDRKAFDRSVEELDIQ
jgi:hypothetical protein